MSGGLQSFGVGNKEIKSNSFDRFKGKKGERYRVGVIIPPGEDPFLGAQRHYSEAGQTSFLCKSTKDHQEICCTHQYKGNEPAWKIVAAIVVYNIDEGKVKGGKVLPWVFNEKTYNLLSRIAEDDPLDERDLELECTDDKYQTFTIVSKKGSYWQQSEKFKATCLSEAASIRKKAKVFIGKDLSIAEIKEVLGISDFAGDTAAELDLSDLASEA